MRKLKAFMIAAVLAMATRVHAGTASIGSLTFDPDSRQVAVSTNCATATQIMLSDSFVSHNIVVNVSSWTVLYVSSSSSNLSPSSSPFVPTNSSFSPDGPVDAYNGPMWACSSSTVSNIQAFGLPKTPVMRFK